MKEFNLINLCLSTLKSSRMDVITKLRLENLLIGMKSLLLVEVEGPAKTQDLEDLFRHVSEVCTGTSTDGVKGLVEHLRKVELALATA